MAWVSSIWSHIDQQIFLQQPLERDTGEPELTFAITTKKEDLPGSWQDGELAHTGSMRREDGRSYLYVYDGSDFDVVRFTDVADFYLWSSHNICHLLDPAYEFAIDIYLLGTVLSLWFERQGVIALHASAFAVEDRAIAFLVSNSGGKSSLAATFMQAGYALLTDDVLLVEQADEQGSVAKNSGVG